MFFYVIFCRKWHHRYRIQRFADKIHKRRNSFVRFRIQSEFVKRERQCVLPNGNVGRQFQGYSNAQIHGLLFHTFDHESMYFSLTNTRRNLPVIVSNFQVLNIKFTRPETTDFFTKLVTESIKSREESGLERQDMMHLLMLAKKGSLTYDDSGKDLKDGFATVEESSIGMRRVKRSN